MIYRATSKDLDFVATLAARLWPWHTKEEIANDYAIPGAFQPFLKGLFS